MENSRFEKQLEFLIKADKLKNVLRQTVLVDESRQETVAEHSWHFALTAATLLEYSNFPKIDMLKVLKMALVHDLVEVYAGGTPSPMTKPATQIKRRGKKKPLTGYSACCRRNRRRSSADCGKNLKP